MIQDFSSNLGPQNENLPQSLLSNNSNEKSHQSIIRYEVFLKEENLKNHLKKRTHAGLYRFNSKDEGSIDLKELTHQKSKSLTKILKPSKKAQEFELHSKM